MPVLAPALHAVLRAALDALVPRDEWPGAVEAAADTYVLAAVASDLGWLTRGLEGLDQEARVRCGVGFARLRSDTAADILRAVEEGRTLSDWSSLVEPIAFMEELVVLAHEGYYAAPAIAAGDGVAAWHMLGYCTRRPRRP